MRYVSFFRNVNLGRAYCPTKAQLEQAFLIAGADYSSSFLVNGTLVFAAKDHECMNGRCEAWGFGCR